MADFKYFHVLSVFSRKKVTKTQKSVQYMGSAKVRSIIHNMGALKDVNINTGVQSINTKSFINPFTAKGEFD